VQRIDCLNELARLRKDELVVCTLAKSAQGWLAASGDRDGSIYLMSSMGSVSSFALGLASSLPAAGVWAIDSDGAVVMNFGGLLTLAANQPPNMKHFVMSNRVYEATGCQSIVNADKTDYVGVAKSAGIDNAYSFDDIGVFKERIPAIVSAPEYAMVVLEIELDDQHYEPYPDDPLEQTWKFGRHVERSFGVTVFR
jgi:thiamine pyrophosphate-dependent acetolactate synthase large subunit-like protein